MDRTFEDSFNKFFLKIVVLNYKNRESLPYTKEDQRIMRLLNILIPIYNRLESNDSISLEDLESSSTIPIPIIKTELDTVEKQNLSDSEDEVDLVGDQQIEKLTEESLKLLQEIRTNGWVNVESENEEDDDVLDYSKESQTVTI
ncbi:hypothetical protein Klosneuvirus_1_265 [Klosneuvirus KNV1]|uniref:Uncharacterized protein n=1 Tax=Klosneuvirus KNV1 TaxID=1977640 RepID=A0A1V0SIF9_9VIRU|nr:hypothetical protein Klosneuvirus_1_265 [Klosneuvirus KNV1]